MIRRFIAMGCLALLLRVFLVHIGTSFQGKGDLIKIKYTKAKSKFSIAVENELVCSFELSTFRVRDLLGLSVNHVNCNRKVVE